MSKYVIPIFDSDTSECFIKVIIARSIEDCQNKLMKSFTIDYEMDIVSDYKDFLRDCNEIGLYLGNIEDIEEL